MERESERPATEFPEQLMNELPNHKLVDIHPRHEEAMRLLTFGLCRIREAAFDAPQHTVQLADALHNIPALLTGNDRADDQYLVQQMANARALIGDQSWRLDVGRPTVKRGPNRMEKGLFVIMGLVGLISLGWWGWANHKLNEAYRCVNAQSASGQHADCLKDL